MDIENKSLEELIVIYKTWRRCPKEQRTAFINGCFWAEVKEQIIVKVLGELNEAVNAEFGDYLKIMEFCTDWRYGDIESSASLDLKDVSFSIYYVPFGDRTGIYCYDPLVKFVFDINEANLSGKTAMSLFKKMKKPIHKILKATYPRWTKSMADYYSFLFQHAKNPDYIERIRSPRDCPERYFLYHRVIDLE